MIPTNSAMSTASWSSMRAACWRTSCSSITRLAELQIFFYEMEDETIWGATARILTGFLTHLVEGR